MMTAEELVVSLQEVEKNTNEQWVDSLEDRKKKEMVFHDVDRDRQRRASLKETDPKAYKKFYGNRKYYQVKDESTEYMKNWIRENALGKVFLDCACGNGQYAILAAKSGAKLAIGIDISPLSIENAKKDAEQAGVKDNIYFLLSDAENTRLPADSVDAVICWGVLHHMDLSYVFPELRRILSPGGKVLAGEALSYNPAITLYRKLTPQMRTDWEKEHILNWRSLRFAEHFFDIGEVKYWHIAGILGAYMKSFLPALNKIDRFLAKIPLIRLMAWMFTFELVKSKR